LSNDSNTLVIGPVNIPLPPSDIALTDYAKWISDQLPDVPIIDILALTKDLEQELNSQLSQKFIRDLEQIYTSQANNGMLRVDWQHRNMVALRTVLDHITRELPPPLSIKQIGSHPHTVPPRPSSRLTSSRDISEMMSLLLLEECLCMNSLLLRIEQDAADLGAHLLSGWDMLPSHLVTIANSLCVEMVPAAWITNNFQPDVQPIMAWMSNLKRRHRQMADWIRDGLLPTERGLKSGDSSGALNSVWLGGLFNPEALLMAILHRKASTSGCLIAELELRCAVASHSVDAEADKDVLVLTDLVLQGVEWNHQKGCLTSSKRDLNDLPALAVWPHLKTVPASQEDSQHMFHCQMFTNKFRQCCIGYLPLPVDDTIGDHTKSDVAIILNQEFVADGNETRLVIGRHRRKLVKPYFGDDSFTESLLQLAELIMKDVSQPHSDGSGPSTPSQLSYNRAAAPNDSPLPPQLRLTRGSPLEPEEAEEHRHSSAEGGAAASEEEHEGGSSKRELSNVGGNNGHESHALDISPDGDASHADGESHENEHLEIPSEHDKKIGEDTKLIHENLTEVNQGDDGSAPGDQHVHDNAEELGGHDSVEELKGSTEDDMVQPDVKTVQEGLKPSDPSVTGLSSTSASRDVGTISPGNQDKLHQKTSETAGAGTADKTDDEDYDDDEDDDDYEYYDDEDEDATTREDEKL
jgi:hypothetical protein